MGKNGWGMVFSLNSTFSVIFFFFEAGERQRRKESAVSFIMALVLKPFKK